MADRTFKVPHTVRDLIRRLHPQLKRKLRAALREILDDPNCGKPLQWALKEYWSLRIGRFRVVYRPDEAGAEIVAIGPRPSTKKRHEGLTEAARTLKAVAQPSSKP